MRCFEMPRKTLNDVFRRELDTCWGWEDETRGDMGNSHTQRVRNRVALEKGGSRRPLFIIVGLGDKIDS